MQGEIVGGLKGHCWRLMLPEMKFNLMHINFFFNVREKFRKCLGV